MTKSAHDFYQIQADRVTCPFPMRGLEFWFVQRSYSAGEAAELRKRQRAAHEKTPQFSKDYPNWGSAMQMKSSGLGIERIRKGVTYLPPVVRAICDRYVMACSIALDRELNRALLREFRRRGMEQQPREFNIPVVYCGLVKKWADEGRGPIYFETLGSHEIVSRLTKEGGEGPAILAVEIADAVQENLIG